MRSLACSLRSRRKEVQIALSVLLIALAIEWTGGFVASPLRISVMGETLQNHSVRRLAEVTAGQVRSRRRDRLGGLIRGYRLAA